MNATVQKLNKAMFPLDVANRFEMALTSHGTLNLLAISLRIAPVKEAVHLCDAYMASLAGNYPVTPFLKATYSDARWYAESCLPVENKAYCLAHFQHMSVGDRAAFLGWADEKVAG